MAKYQLWSRDEYGQGNIVMSFDKIEDAFIKAKASVTDINVNNALAGDDMKRNWEAFFPIVDSKKSKTTQFVYGGSGPLNRQVFYSINIKTGEVKEIPFTEIPNPEVKIYLGNVSNKRKGIEDWMATDAKNRPIESIDHPDLKGKMSFFVKVIK